VPERSVTEIQEEPVKEDLSPRLPALTVSAEPLSATRAPTLVIGLFQGAESLTGEVEALDNAVGGKIGGLVESGDFSAKADEVALLYSGAPGGPERICLVGLGMRDRFSPDGLKSAAAAAARYLKKLGVDAVALPYDLASESGLPGPAAARDVFLGAALGLYSFSSFKKSDNIKKTVRRIIICGDPSIMGGGPKEGRIMADSVYLARDLANTPANLMTPTMLAERARDAAEAAGVDIEVLDKKGIERLKMGALLGVARGSAEPPVLIVLKYLPAGHEEGPVALIGKGITFDSGGISLKPPENMDRMKTDMSGGAAVLGAVVAAARLRLPLGVVGVIPATENMPGPGATKPGDVLVAMDKTTIEVISTDAEGRLVLADGIGYAKRFEPSLILDIATLTGSAVIALGRRVAALYSSRDDLLGLIQEAARGTGEQVWPMPLFDHYFDQIKGDVADVRNSTGRDGGSITAAAFLKRFAGDAIPWAHLDIAGTARAEKDYGWASKGATGWGVTTLVEFLRLYAARKNSLPMDH
jgi:leucyl aminopeptidase